MKASYFLFMVFGLMLAIPVAAETDSDMVRVALRIYATEAGQEEKLVSQPIMAIRAGTTATVKSNIELTYPSVYEPGSYPKAHAEALGIDAESKDLTDANLIIPPFPTKQESKNLGISLELRPVIENGAVSVGVQCLQAGLSGFVDYGSLITYKRKGALGKERDIPLTHYQILSPSFDETVASARIEGSGELLLKAETPNTEIEFAQFGEEFSAPQLPELRVEVEAKIDETKLAALPEIRQKTPEETRSIVGNQRAIDLLGETPAENFKQLGIPLQGIQIDDDHNITAIGKKVALDRLTKLIDLYKGDPQIYITSKFIETDQPIENLDSTLMTDPQFQVFIRGISQQKGTDLLSAPSVMTRPFRDAKIEVIREFIYPTSYDPPNIGEKSEDGFSFPVTPAKPTTFSTRPLGVTLEVALLLHEDGSLELRLQPEVSGLKGMLDFSQAIHQLDVKPLGKPRLIQISKNECINPVFESVAIDTKVRIPDGTTVVIGGVPTKRIQSIQDKVPVLGDLPLVGQLAKSETTIEETRYLYIAITATIVDPAGAALSQR